jgi:hypothetical protein
MNRASLAFGASVLAAVAFAQDRRPAPGKHTLELLFADYQHIPFDPTLHSRKITITVK